MRWKSTKENGPLTPLGWAVFVGYCVLFAAVFLSCERWVW